MKAIERLMQYIEYKGLNNRTFEINNDLSNGYLGKQLLRKADLGESIIVKILDNCPDIDMEWLLTGKGSMLKKVENSVDLSNGIDYKELYLDAKYTIEVQKKYIQSLELEIGNKRVAG